jgi:hypothetical protein
MKVNLISFLIAITALCSCTSKHSENKGIQTLVKTQQSELFDSADVKSYIGFVNRYYFQKTDEFYVDLYFKRTGISNKDYDRIANTHDSVIYKDDENRRCRIPLKIAGQEFDVTGIETLTLFDKNHKMLTKAHFVRVEYLDQTISPVFTAVYKAENTRLAAKALYCIGNLTDKVVADKYTSFEDTLLTKEIAQKMGCTHKYTLEGKHYRNKDHQISISVINSDTTVLIVEKKNNSYKCLYKSHEPENINDIVFIPVIRNSRPVLLTKSFVPDTDVEWNSLLIFDGNIYEPSDRQRIQK